MEFTGTYMTINYITILKYTTSILCFSSPLTILSAIFVKVFVRLRHSSLQAASAAAACSEFMRISRGLLPMFGPTMLRSSISSMRRAARV